MKSVSITVLSFLLLFLSGCAKQVKVYTSHEISLQVLDKMSQRPLEIRTDYDEVISWLYRDILRDHKVLPTDEKGFVVTSASFKMERNRAFSRHGYEVQYALLKDGYHPYGITCQCYEYAPRCTIIDIRRLSITQVPDYQGKEMMFRIDGHDVKIKAEDE